MNEELDTTKVPHYYGDKFRVLLLCAASLMLVALPSVTSEIGMPVMFSIVGILLLVLAAGLTNPQQRWVAGLNTIIATVGFLLFESYAVSVFQEQGAYDRFFITNLVIGFIFLFAVYFSVKTLRFMLLQKGGG